MFLITTISQYGVYLTSTKKQKMMISRSIVDKVRTELNPPGRFLKKIPQTRLWYVVEDKKALEKTAKKLRDGAAALRKPLTDDMGDSASPSIKRQKRQAPLPARTESPTSTSTDGVAKGLGLFLGPISRLPHPLGQSANHRMLR